MTIEVGWQERTLGELCSLRRELVEPSSTGAHRYVGLEHIDPGFLRLRRWGMGRDVRSSKSRFHSGDILYGKLRPYLDKAAVAEWEGVCSTDILTLQPHKDEANPQYIGFLLHTSAFLSYAVATTSGVNHPRTSWADIARFSYAVPPFQDQRAIAWVLSKIQAALEVQERIVATLRELKGAAMAKLFREGLRGEPLKQTEIGEIPESWDLVPMGQLLRTAQYGLSLRGEKTGRYPILRMNCQEDGEVVFRDLQHVDLDDPTFTSFKLNDGDLLFNRTNSIDLVGRTAIFRGGDAAVFASYLIRLRVDENMILPDFLNYYLNLEQVQLALKTLATRGVSQSNISASRLRLFNVPLPPKQEQADIIKALHGLTAPLGAAIRKRDTLKALFSSMLHRLMSGQVRVTRKMIALQALEDRRKQRPKWSGKVDEKVMEEVVRRIVEAVAPEKIILFGSAARGEMGPDGDLDLLVVKACDSPREVERLVYRRLIGIGVPKDVLVVTPQHLDKHKDTIGYIYRPALREGKLIYAR